jgi:hypothetical protein
VNTMAAAFCVDCGLPLTGRYCGACGRDYGETDAAQRSVFSNESTAGAQQEVAEAQQDVSSSTAGAQRAVSPASRPCARREGGVHNLVLQYSVFSIQ